jgi:hypothetical protein
MSMRYRITTTDEETIAVRMTVFSLRRADASRVEMHVSLIETHISPIGLVADRAP